MRRQQTDVTDELRAFLGQIDTAFLATASADGQPYVQHRGGPRGFIRALDDHTLAFVDLGGNRQYLSIGNLRENARVCLFLIDYARRQRVKLWGTATITPLADADLTAFVLPPKARPERIIRIQVTGWDVNCPAHIPQKLDAQDVAAALGRLEARIVELERENSALRARSPRMADTARTPEIPHVRRRPQ